MINPLVIFCLQIQTKKTKKDICNRLNKYSKLEQLNGNHLFYNKSIFDSDSVNANSAFFNIILVNYGWALHLIRNPNEETDNAFKITIGHELGHKAGDFPISMKYLFSRNAMKLIFWSNEVQHDFYSAKIMVDYSRDALISSMKYKIKLKKNNKSDLSHPSWAKRLYYAEHFDFNEDLIKQIAIDTKCDNLELVKEIVDFYGIIELK